MTKNKRKYQVTIISAIDELQRAYKALNKKYFKETLEDVIITIQTDPKKSAFAWISVGKTWNDHTDTYYHEINVVAEWLSRDPADVIASLLHEMCHLWNMQQGIQDCSRGGSYHNDKFKEAALAHGLTCDKSPKYGWTITGPSDELREWVQDNIRNGCLRFKRIATWADGTPKKPKEGTPATDENGRPAIEKKGKSNIRKYVCPECGLIIRASKDISFKVLCAGCTSNKNELIFFIEK